MAIASGGGHWVQMRRIMPAFEGLDVFYVSLDPSAAADVPGRRYYTVRDVSRRDRIGFAVLAAQLARILLRERPQTVITTGSAPCLIALGLAKALLRSRTIWIDSIANVERLSSSGAQARRVADIWLTQWEHLARPEGPQHWGAVL
ncbi:PssD/Cps14F family polysaccharide biosynthesis glycosyltransferase [soil metagenome]